MSHSTVSTKLMPVCLYVRHQSPATAIAAVLVAIASTHTSHRQAMYREGRHPNSDKPAYYHCAVYRLLYASLRFRSCTVRWLGAHGACCSKSTVSTIIMFCSGKQLQLFRAMLLVRADQCKSLTCLNKNLDASQTLSIHPLGGKIVFKFRWEHHH